jgi:hypothetical protein
MRPTMKLRFFPIRHPFKPTDGAHIWPNGREYLAETRPLLFR